MWNEWSVKTRMPKATILVALLLPIALIAGRPTLTEQLPPKAVVSKPARAETDGRRETAPPEPKSPVEFAMKRPIEPQPLPFSAADGPVPLQERVIPRLPPSLPPVAAAAPAPVPAPMESLPQIAPATTRAAAPVAAVGGKAARAAAKAARKAAKRRRIDPRYGAAAAGGALGLLLLANEL
jgi:hypothetical protein